MAFVEQYVELIQKWRHIIICLWVVIVLAGVYPALNFIGITTQKFSAPAGTQASDAMASLKRHFPETADSTPFVAYVEANEGTSSVVSEQVANFTLSLCARLTSYVYKETRPVGGCLSYYTVPFEPIRSSFLSASNRSTIINVILNANYLSDASGDFTNFMGDALSENTWILGNGYAATLSGMPYFLRATMESTSHDLGMMDAIVLPLSMLVLAYFVGSIRLIVIPILSIGMTAATSFAVMFFVGQVISVNSAAPALMMSVMIAMSIDYALFLLTRYREELLLHNAGVAGVTKVIATAGHTIAVSGTTLGACFLSLTFFKQDMLVSLGIANACVIFVTLLVNLTLVPAILLTFSAFFERSVNRGEETPIDYEATRYYRFGEVITAWPRNIFVVLFAVGIAVPFAMQGVSLHKTDAYLDYLPRGQPVTTSYSSMLQEFGGGYLCPYKLQIVPRDPTTNVLSRDFFSKSSSMLIAVLSDPSLPSTRPNVSQGVMIVSGVAVDFDVFQQCVLNPVSSPQCGALLFLRNGTVNAAASTVWVSLLLTIDALGDDGDKWYRNALTLLKGYEDVYQWDMYLSGTGATSMDAIDNVYESFPDMIAMSSGIVFVFLALCFRSIVIPLRAVLTISMTLMWVFGFAAMTYQKGALNWLHIASLSKTGAISWSVPVLSYAIVIGIGLDYDIFLLSRMMEYVHPTRDARESIVLGLSSTGTIITAAGAIMAIAFSGLLLSSTNVINQMGFMMVFSVIFDTFVIRTCVVPALMSILGDWNWWPSRHFQKGIDIQFERLSAVYQPEAGSMSTRGGHEVNYGSMSTHGGHEVN